MPNKLFIPPSAMADFDAIIERHIEDFHQYMDQRTKMHRAAMMMAAINSLEKLGQVPHEPTFSRWLWLLRACRRMTVRVYRWVIAKLVSVAFRNKPRNVRTHPMPPRADPPSVIEVVPNSLEEKRSTKS